MIQFRHAAIRLRAYSQPILTLILVVVAWEAICDTAHIPVWLLPPPSRIWAETAQLAPVLPMHVLSTLITIVGGFVIATLTGVPLAVVVVYSPALRRLIYPPMLMLQSVPKVAIAPLFLMWLGYGLPSNMVVAATVAFFPIVVDTATGLEAIEPEILELTSSFEPSRLKVFWKVRLPWAMPYLFSGLKVGMTLAVVGAIVAEFIGADRGLGYLILSSSGSMNTGAMFGVLAILSAVGILCFYAVVISERLLFPWYLSRRDDGAN